MITDPIHMWEDDGGMIYAPDYESHYLRDESYSLKVGLSPEEPINPDKVGVIDTATIGVQVSCGGFMGNAQLMQFHFADSKADGITWLHAHGCGKIVDITMSQIL